MQGYAKYKDSGVGWLGEIPAGWATAPIRSLFTESRKKNRKLEDNNYLSLMAGVGVIPYAEKGDVGNKMPEDLSNCKIVTPNDFVLNSMNFGIGSFGRSKYQGVCSSVYIILKGRDIAQLSYFERVFQQPLFQKFSQSLGNGILAHRCAIGWDELKNERFPVPPFDEVLAISTFLDDKVSKVDELAVIKRRQIELLAERKKILIQNAIIKGLNPDAPMKNSGVDWIGQIPAHWEATKLRYLGTFQNGISAGAEYFGSGYPFVTYGDVYNNSVLPSKPSGLAKSSSADRLNYSIKEGDVLFTRTSEVANDIGVSSTCLKTIENASFSGFVIRMRPATKLTNPEYSKYLFRCSYISDFFAHEMNIVIRASLGQELLKNLPIFLPPSDEQEEIIAYCDLESGRIDDAITIKEKQISKLNEYKTTLINAAVTGKIKVV